MATKICYHGELVKMGPVQVTVNSDVLKSRYKGKDDYVILKIGNEERNYNVENPQCAAFFQGQKGRTFVIVAEGSRAQATLTYVGESGAALQPPPPRNPPPPQQPPYQAPPQQQYQPPPQQAPPPQQPQGYNPALARGAAPPPNNVNAVTALNKVKVRIAQNLTAIKIAMKAAMLMRAEWCAVHKQEEMPEIVFDKIFASCLYGLDRSGFVEHLPTMIDYATLQPMARQQQQQASPRNPPPPQQPPPQQTPTPTPAQYGTPAEPEDPNVPF